eukprot:CAMPEP_0118709738 /NCGR_PEP_ID=MMETSP0800-20121206/22867_1 /TAXON_ID=210618 ORGANISM="Striatella unipunctata, Strain CCMP2910" /NCGR_SAMPLE_ID=MMETSP0800 /ASSEMBLY_ACC=CAM_ASM_000638 /LENGTH=176 /DNA_ID=CAMNT_0006613591 /DNA_START=308 /DNA_END=834 /DNA_ORIENTATION=-
MSLVTLGACFFTMCGQMGFRSSTMGWDAARVSAAIPSGVGFLGAGLIWKGSTTTADGKERHQVRGITTAATVWLSASVGVAIGGRLYVISMYAVALILFVLRLGPRAFFSREEKRMEDARKKEAHAEGLLLRKEVSKRTVTPKKRMSIQEFDAAGIDLREPPLRTRKSGADIANFA